MKGVILGIAPQARLVDLSHGIGPQDVRAAAFVLGRIAPYFPDGTIHLVVVDPGVGTQRRSMAARLGPQFFVGPDNGVATRWIGRAERTSQPMSFVVLDRPEHWLPGVSPVFHGRDVFAPVAARLANGVPLAELGSPFEDPVRLDLPEPTAIQGGQTSTLTYTIRVFNGGLGATPYDVFVSDSDITTQAPAFSGLLTITNVSCSVVTLNTCDAANLTGGGINVGQLAATDGKADGSDEATITVTVSASPNPTTDLGTHTNTAYLVYVAIDDAGRPAPVSPLQPENDLERQRMAEAEQRQAKRLARRSK